jgi:hypothetical protein
LLGFFHGEDTFNYKIAGTVFKLICRIMKELFKTQYCPHCNAPLDFSDSIRPSNCPFCNGLIWYGRFGQLRKAWFKVPNLPTTINDMIVVAMMIGALLWAYFLINN